MAKTIYKDSTTGLAIKNNGKAAASDDCCCIEMISGTCCGDGTTEMPKYLQVVISGVQECGDNLPSGRICLSCTEVNGTFVLEWNSSCTWSYSLGYLSIAAWLQGAIWYVEASNSNYGAYVCFYGGQSVLLNNKCDALPVTIYNGNYNDNCEHTYICNGYDGSAVLSIL